MKIKTIAATTSQLFYYGQYFRFNKSKLKKLADTSIGKEVTDNFNKRKIIGTVTNAEVIGNKLVVEFNSNFDFINSKKALVVGFIEEPFELLNYAITNRPLDINIPFIEINQ